MKLALDYDDTYTLDPLLWNWFAKEAMERGHEVYCVSARHEDHMDEPMMTIGRVVGAERCFGTNHKPKREFMRDVYKMHFDVWVDDMPEMVVSPNDLHDL